VTELEQDDELLEQSPDAVGLDLVTGDRDLVAADVDRNRERVLDHAQQLIALAEQANHEMVARDKKFDRGGRVRRCQGAREGSRGSARR